MRIDSRTYRAPTSLRLTRIAVFTALSVVGSFLHFPGPVQSVAFDSAPGFFAALYFGPVEGAAVTGLAHVATSVINGFPLGLWHFPIALGLAVAGAVIGYVNRSGSKVSSIKAIAAGIAINTGLVVLAAPALGWAATLSFAPILFLAASLNGVVAVSAYLAVKGRV